MLFTHFGLSGPIALRCSGFIRGVKQKNGGADVTMAIDLFPGEKAGELGSACGSWPRRNRKKR